MLRLHGSCQPLGFNSFHMNIPILSKITHLTLWTWVSTVKRGGRTGRPDGAFSLCSLLTGCPSGYHLFMNSVLGTRIYISALNIALLEGTSRSRSSPLLPSPARCPEAQWGETRRPGHPAQPAWRHWLSGGWPQRRAVGQPLLRFLLALVRLGLYFWL